MKYFMITVDTEEDNQWCMAQEQTTQNSKYLPRFQELCEKYKYIPVYLTTYGMGHDPFFIDYFKNKSQQKLCEIGMHMHAWNNSPVVALDRSTEARPYITEYEKEVVFQKAYEVTKYLEGTFETKIVSHRSGRWALNDDYLQILSELGYLVDTTITPHVSWRQQKGGTGIGGNDYTGETENVSKKTIIEVPMTIRRIRQFKWYSISIKGIAKTFRDAVFGNNIWLRASGESDCLSQMKKVVDIVSQQQCDYAMFMIHSSELMPGQNPSFKNEADIEKLYVVLDDLFKYLQDQGFVGISLKDYAMNKCNI